MRKKSPRVLTIYSRLHGCIDESCITGQHIMVCSFFVAETYISAGDGDDSYAECHGASDVESMSHTRHAADLSAPLWSASVRTRPVRRPVGRTTHCALYILRHRQAWRTLRAGFMPISNSLSSRSLYRDMPDCPVAAIRTCRPSLGRVFSAMSSSGVVSGSFAAVIEPNLRHLDVYRQRFDKNVS